MLAEPICGVLPIAPSTYFRHKAAPADPTRRTARAQRDDELRAIIRRIGTEHHQVYRPRKLWRQTGGEILRCSSARIPRRALPRASVDARDGLVGATRGRAWVTTTEAGPTSERGKADLSIVSSPRRGPISPEWRIALRRDLAGLRVRRVRH